MPYRKIEIPGNKTIYEDAPRVRVVGQSDESVALVIVYCARRVGDEGPPFGEITFESVFEYRWRSSSYFYEEHVEHESDIAFGLIEVLDSRYIEAMVSFGMFEAHAGKRFGSTIPESAVRHFRISFDNYGTFDVIALDVSVRAHDGMDLT